MATSLPPGIRRTVRANSMRSPADEPRPDQSGGQTAGGVPAGQPPPPTGCAPGPTAPEKETARLRRIETYDSITTSIGEGEMESYSAADTASPGGPGQQGYTSYSVERFRRKLRFFFMNPYEKWKAKRKFPWKLVLQLVKVVLATVQLTSFGFSRSSHVNFLEKSNIAFKHLYLKDWNPSFETLPYPPATGVYALYTIPTVYDSINYAMERYNRTESLAIGTFRYDLDQGAEVGQRLCNTHYRKGEIFNGSYNFNTEIVTDCVKVGPFPKNSTGKEEWVYDIKQLLHYKNHSIYFDNVIRLELKFSLMTVHLKALTKHDRPDCYIFNISIVYENQEHDGQMQVKLVSDEVPLRCHGHVAYPTDEEALIVAGSVFDTVVILISFSSMLLCIRSIYRAQKLRRETCKFFIRQYDYKLIASEQMEFVDLWYLLIIVNDALTIIGSVVKILIENKAANSYELCGTTLGTASLLVWFGVLRYLGFFEKYNVLILTLKKSAPNVLRFLLCAVVFYLGFAFCGWVVLGPFHMKFREISTASECLFSLVNGDDMFVTFSIIGNSQNNYVWFYSRIYLYLFISLFIYVVLSVFISVIMDTYETIKYYYEHGFPKSILMKFVEECSDDPSSPVYRSDDSDGHRGGGGVLSCLDCFNCCHRGSPLDDATFVVPADQPEPGLANGRPAGGSRALDVPFSHDLSLHDVCGSLGGSTPILSQMNA